MLLLFLLWVGALMTHPLASAAPDDRFLGGSYDGFATGATSSWTAPAPGSFARFIGNGFDGHASAQTLSWSGPAPGSRPQFLGSGYDGFASATFTTWSSPSPGSVARFVGDAYDGFAAAQALSYTPPAPGQLPRFLGAAYDGHDDSAALNQPNPLSGDDDGDGVPDWWEAWRHQSVTLADAQTDLDHDGDGDWHEFLADTDPDDPLSRLTLSFTGNAPNLTCTAHQTSTERIYRLEYSITLQAGSWISLTDPAVPGTGADLTFPQTTNLGPTVYFRTAVTLAP